MTTHRTGTRDEWLRERLALLEAEKALTRQSDELARRRQALPWVPVEKMYRFQVADGEATLADLFQGRSQLLVYHFMFGPDYTAGCPSCSMIADGFNGFWQHLASHDVTLSAVSRAPIETLLAYRKRMGCSFPWASSFGGDFNFDYSVGLTEEQQDRGYDYNYQSHGVVSRNTPERAPDLWRHVWRRPADLPARAAGDECVQDRGRRDLPHLLDLWARADALGAPIRGSTALRSGATKAKACGGNGAMNMRRRIAAA